MSDKVMTVYAVMLTFYGALIGWTFVGTFHRRSRGRWRHDSMGRHVMAFTTVDALVFTFLATGYVFPWLAGLPAFRWAYLIAGVTGIPWCITWRMWILLRPRDRDGARR